MAIDKKIKDIVGLRFLMSNKSKDAVFYDFINTVHHQIYALLVDFGQIFQLSDNYYLSNKVVAVIVSYKH